MKTIKWMFGLCLMVLVICGSGVNVHAYSSLHVTDDGIKYESYTNKDYIVITGYKGTNETVIIPSELDGKPVESITGSFFNTRKIKQCVIPEGVVRIGNDIHWDSRSVTTLESVSLPSTLKTIGDGAFAECCNLSNVILPQGLTTIGHGAFYNCDSLEKITIPEGVTSIGNVVFDLCDNLNSITISNNLTTIGNCAFYYQNPKLTIYANSNSYARKYANGYRINFACLNEHDWDKGAVTTKPTAIKDGIKTFTCTACKTTKTQKIAKLGLPRKGKSLTEPTSKTIYKVTKSAAKNGTVELTKPNKSKNNVTVPDTVTFDGVTYKVTSISKNAFKDNKKLKKVTIGKNVSKINSSAFYGCKNLKTVTIKSTQLKTVGKNAFKGVNTKAKIKVPKSRLKSYKKLFAKKGQKSTVQIVK